MNYCNKTYNTSPLSEEEEHSLLVQLTKKDTSARHILIEHYLPLVVSTAIKYISYGELDDLVQYGAYGLTMSTYKYDINFNVKFNTYATYWIKEAIIRYIQNEWSQIRIPVNKRQKLGVLIKQKDSFYDIHHRYPTNQELSELLNCQYQEIETLQNAYVSTTSLESTLFNDDGEEITSQYSSDETYNPDYWYIKKDLSKTIRKALTILSATEANIIRLHFGIDASPMTTTAICKKLGISRQRMNFLENKAFQKIRDSEFGEGLKLYLT